MGAHSFKLGGELTKSQINSMANWGAGNFGFSGIFSGMGYADFLLGLPDSYSMTSKPNGLGARRTAAAGFVQDNYRVSRNLTLNFGLRYQFEGGFSERHNRLSNFNPNLQNPVSENLGAIEFASSSKRTLHQTHPPLFSPPSHLPCSPATPLL